jgi:hypothetical protein
MGLVGIVMQPIPPKQFVPIPILSTAEYSFLADINPGKSCNLQFDRYSFMELTLIIRYKIVILLNTVRATSYGCSAYSM